MALVLAVITLFGVCVASYRPEYQPRSGSYRSLILRSSRAVYGVFYSASQPNTALVLIDLYAVASAPWSVMAFQGWPSVKTVRSKQTILSQCTGYSDLTEAEAVHG